MSSDDGFGRLLRSMLGPPEPQPGPPYAHALAMPETEEEIAAQPYLPTMTVEREIPAAFLRLPAGPERPIPGRNCKCSLVPLGHLDDGT